VDKGLHCQDFKTGRGQSAFQAARHALSQIKSEASRSDPTVVWATKKLTDYEEMQKSGERYPRSPFARTVCSYDDLINLIHTRRSIRWYRSQLVNDDVIYKIIEVINWSSTSCNRQPARVFATNNPVTARKCMDLCSGSSGFSEYIPLFVAFAADIRVYEMAHEVMLPYIDISLGIQNCCLVAHTLGLSLNLLTWAQHTDDQDRQLRILLNIPDHYQIIVNAAGGYPIGGAQTPSRKKLDETLILHK
jgi:nitroreductase